MLGTFLSIEGIEGVGKSTAVQYIQQYLTSLNQEIILTREPGGTTIAEELRHLILTPHTEQLTPDAELLMIFAGRSQHIECLIKPALQQGKWVVTDRFIDATYAYQGSGRKLDLNKIKILDQWIVNGLMPNKTILLDAPAEIGLARARHRGPQDRIEQEQISFFERVRQGYLTRAHAEPNRFSIIDATQPLERVHQMIKKTIDQMKIESSQ